MNPEQVDKLMEKVKWAKNPYPKDCAFWDVFFGEGSSAQARQMIEDGWRPHKEPPSTDKLSKIINQAYDDIPPTTAKMDGWCALQIANKLHEALKAYYEGVE